MEDIRKKETIRHEDVVSLNFMRKPTAFVFRRHRLNGLRSHIMEVLAAEDVKKENQGVVANGLLRYPKARPRWMLRIFRKKFDSPKQVLEEIRRFQIIVQYLGTEYVAASQEFIVDYSFGKSRDILLCGLQEYVEGQELDPWSSVKENFPGWLARKIAEEIAGDESFPVDRIEENIIKSAGGFVARVKKMILKARYVPDLAGMRNILLTKYGRIKLVDINNISVVQASGCPLIDDFDYPVCDKSIEALSMIEIKILGRRIDRWDPVYRQFMEPQRRREVEILHQKFNATARGRWIGDR